MRPILRRLLVALLLLPFAAAGCSTSTPDAQSQASPETSDERLQVIATFLPMYLFTKAIAGDAADVEVLIQPGTEVHDYQSTPEDVRAIAEADVLVQNGLNMEEFLDSTIDSAQNSELVVINASENIDPVGELSPVVFPTEESGEAHDHGESEAAEHSHGEETHSHGEETAAGEADHSHGEETAAASESDPDHAEETVAAGEATAADDHAHDHEGESAGGFHTHAENPHVWLDPVLAVRQVETIRDGLIEADPNNAETYEANAAAYIEELQALNAEFEQRLGAYSDRTFISFHDAFPYLAERYDLQQVAIVAIPEDSLSPTDIQQTVEVVKEYDVKALFGEPGVDNRLLQSLSQDLGVELQTLDSLESGELDPQYYFTAMNQNLEALETAFQ
ncbi:MAG: zinc ABC transporter solute-binding protein [Leptolyngbyaceae cyanobacterium RM2_2_4]|nr:zinc ABC transporter solute-binding protein [Leptolyngbyaceae cyanobacterium SM1_4_3]NJN56291.1 zinc ABC transporter solute-binding protein [Leptolyngbyaceae cyanobacterium SL_5_9]NJO51519.1 zinc ABC transporter solute-binding protein [Leptolyngbyaceae cyanobacterium RM2_2_4]